MRAILSLALAALIVGQAAVGSSSSAQSYRSLSRQFAEFADKTEKVPDEARLALFKRDVGALFPQFYAPADGQTGEEFDASVIRALKAFPSLRAEYERAEREFPAAYAASIGHFRKTFPDFTATLPVWFLHSLGRMDGGTRTFGGKTYMIFGADVIARIHNDGTMGAFLDHELFHVENGRWFKDCQPDTMIWCALWQEGAATYAASVLNPGASDHMLMLDQPRPIRGAVDARWNDAVCTLSKDLNKADEATYASYFYGRDGQQTFPPRWGYYLGYRMMQRLGNRYSLTQISRFDNAAAHRLLTQEFGAMVREAGGCDPK